MNPSYTPSDLQKKFKIFISYASEDGEKANKLYKGLKNSDLPIEPWLDKENILPGQDYDIEIKKNIKESDFFIPLFSSTSVEKRGYIQREFKDAIDTLRDIAPGDIFVIPIRLDECEIKYEELRELQRQDLFPEWDEGLARILKSIENGIKEFNLRIENKQLVKGVQKNPASQSQKSVEEKDSQNSKLLSTNDARISAYGEAYPNSLSTLTKILFIYANPPSLKLDLKKEYDIIRSRISESPNKDKFELLLSPNLKRRKLQHILFKHRPDFIHFAGSAHDRKLTLLGDNNLPEEVDFKAITNFFRLLDESKHIKCVFLNACDTEPLAKTLASFVDFAIGIRGFISDAAAIEFAVSFYMALSTGLTIEKAYESGSNNLDILYPREKKNVVLKKRTDFN